MNTKHDMMEAEQENLHPRLAYIHYSLYITVDGADALRDKRLICAIRHQPPLGGAAWRAVCHAVCVASSLIHQGEVLMTQVVMLPLMILSHQQK